METEDPERFLNHSSFFSPAIRQTKRVLRRGRMSNICSLPSGCRFFSLTMVPRCQQGRDKKNRVNCFVGNSGKLKVTTFLDKIQTSDRSNNGCRHVATRPSAKKTKLFPSSHFSIPPPPGWLSLPTFKKTLLLLPSLSLKFFKWTRDFFSTGAIFFHPL